MSPTLSKIIVSAVIFLSSIARHALATPLLTSEKHLTKRMWNDESSSAAVGAMCDYYGDKLEDKEDKKNRRKKKHDQTHDPQHFSTPTQLQWSGPAPHSQTHTMTEAHHGHSAYPPPQPQIYSHGQYQHPQAAPYPPAVYPPIPQYAHYPPPPPQQYMQPTHYSQPQPHPLTYYYPSESSAGVSAQGTSASHSADACDCGSTQSCWP